MAFQRKKPTASGNKAAFPSFIELPTRKLFLQKKPNGSTTPIADLELSPMHAVRGFVGYRNRSSLSWKEVLADRQPER